jgi:hypothetical protein
MSNHPVSFFIRHDVPNNFQCGNISISMHNGQTNERLVIKKAAEYHLGIKGLDCKVVLISRYPLGATKEWIEANEEEALAWNVYNNKYSRNICI